mmetsp:Transcript_83045/g.201254  ORF Transcript_83045/g.201254 Transcript_83045/m.201254 type:complete len:203 (-) Transcript_83045:1491-2099(-)
MNPLRLEQHLACLHVVDRDVRGDAACQEEVICAVDAERGELGKLLHGLETMQRWLRGLGMRVIVQERDFPRMRSAADCFLRMMPHPHQAQHGAHAHNEGWMDLVCFCVEDVHTALLVTCKHNLRPRWVKLELPCELCAWQEPWRVVRHYVLPSVARALSVQQSVARAPFLSHCRLGGLFAIHYQIHGRVLWDLQAMLCRGEP